MPNKPPLSFKPGVIPESFREAETTPGLQIDQQSIKTALYGLSRLCGWTVGGFHWRGGSTRSFYQVDMVHGDRPFSFLLHQSAPLAALSSTLYPGDCELTFLEDNGAQEAARHIGAPFHILSVSELDQSLTLADLEFLRQINSMYRYDVNYWRPTTVGEVLFNWWD